MAFPNVTYTFVNGTAADAGAVNTNFADLIAGASDGTKDINVSAITGGGNATFNGNVVLGNASSDDLTIGASLTADLPIKTTATSNFGGSTKGVLSIYFSLGATYTVRLLGNASGASANWTLTLPAVVGTAGQTLVNQGSGTTAWAYPAGTATAKSADYVVTTTDLIGTVLMTTSTTNRAVTLPTASANTNRIIVIKKVDSATGIVTVDSTHNIPGQYDSMTFQSDGSAWIVIADNRQDFVYRHGTNYNGGSAPTITLASGGGTLSSVTRSEFVVKRRADGSYVLRYHIAVAVSSTARTNATFAINAVTFKNTANFFQPFAAMASTAISLQQCYADPNTANLSFNHASSTTTAYYATGEAELDSLPAWAWY